MRYFSYFPTILSISAQRIYFFSKTYEKDFKCHQMVKLKQKSLPPGLIQGLSNLIFLPYIIWHIVVYICSEKTVLTK